jgi:two-component system, cell cycle response regulator
LEHRSVILVVDDSPSTAAALCDLLKSADHNARSCGDGVEALKLLSGPDIDLVLLDVGIPGMDALQLLRLLRTSERKRPVPVIMLSLRDDREQRLAALKLGADDYLLKPWDPDELLARVGRLLQVRRKVEEALEEGAQLQRRSTEDPLTQLGNQRFFEERLKEEFRRAQRYDDPLSLILVDLDHFKAVNEKLGHPAGDEVLTAVGQILRKALRETDALARYGGDEFASLLPKTPLAGALTVAERVWRDIFALTIPGLGTALTASVGVSAYPSRTVLTPEHLFRTADEALFKAKREGRNRISLYQPVPHVGGG